MEEKQNGRLDFVGIGDVTTDAFIKIKEVEVGQDSEGMAHKISFRLGDKVPYEKVEVVHAVGNSVNAAVSAKRLGLRSSILAYIGEDENGEDCFRALEQEGMDTSLIVKNPDKQTNYHYVLWYEDERTILVNHTEYDYSLEHFKKLAPPRWIYLSSLAKNSLAFQHEIADYVRIHPETKLAFQPGTFQIKLGAKALSDLYQLSEVFFCNKEESQQILSTEESDEKKLLQSMHALGPKIAVITDGTNGAFTFDGEEMWYMPMYPDPAPPQDRTGAGDSFASTFTVALALGKTTSEALEWGPVNSMNVVQHVGAQKGLLSREEIERFLRERPEVYKLEKIN